MCQTLSQPGVFHPQQIQPTSLSRFETKLGSVPADELRALGKQLQDLLKLET